MNRNTVLALLVLCSSAIHAAQDDRVLQAEADVALDKKTEELNKTCGTSIKATIDWPSFAKAKWQTFSIDSFCGSPVESLTYLCGGNNSKAYIKKAIKEFKCSYGGLDQRNLTVKQGVIHYAVDFEASNAEEYTRAALVEKL